MAPMSDSPYQELRDFSKCYHYGTLHFSILHTEIRLVSKPYKDPVNIACKIKAPFRENTIIYRPGKCNFRLVKKKNWYLLKARKITMLKQGVSERYVQTHMTQAHQKRKSLAPYAPYPIPNAILSCLLSQKARSKNFISSLNSIPCIKSRRLIPRELFP